MSGILLASVGNSYGSAPVNTVAPAVTGTASFGSTLTTTNGTWTGAPAPTFTYQWQRVTTNISGATSSTYTLVAADVGNTIRCVVKATNTIAPSGVSANSNSTASVAAVVPGAPTIGTATILYATASVPFTAPASNGGATITSYTATSSPSGITGTLSQAGSGTVTVSGLVGGTSYTFTVTATNSAGTGAASAASNSVAAIAASQQAYTSAGTYSWTAPAGVTSISVVVVGPGGGSGQRAGPLAYTNNYTVIPGNSYSVRVGAAGSGNSSYWIDNSTTYAGPGTTKSTPGYYGGGAAGGGAAGYAGVGPDGNGAGAGGSGGGGGLAINETSGNAALGGGGGVGLLGQGATGATPAVSYSYGDVYAYGGGGGSGGGGGGTSYTGGSPIGTGGTYGGTSGYTDVGGYGTGNGGAVRIIWPGDSRSFPSTNTGDL